MNFFLSPLLERLLCLLEWKPKAVRTGPAVRCRAPAWIQRMWFLPNPLGSPRGSVSLHSQQRRSSGKVCRRHWGAGLIMGPFRAGAAVLVLLMVSGSAPAPAEASLTPRDAARVVVDVYNQETETPAVFKLLKFRSTHKTRFDWGVHFSLNFTIKETSCQKTMANYNLGNCKYKPNGAVKDCSSEVSFLNFIQDTPLASVQCNPVQPANRPSSRKPSSPSKPKAAPAMPRIQVEHYRPAAYSTAAQMAMEDE